MNTVVTPIWSKDAPRLGSLRGVRLPITDAITRANELRRRGVEVVVREWAPSAGIQALVAGSERLVPVGERS